MTPIVVAIALIQFTGAVGQRIDINRAQVTSVREPHDFGPGHFAKGINCLIVMVNGKVIGVMESCEQVRGALMGRGAPGQGPCVLVCGGTVR